MEYMIRWENKNFDDMGTLSSFKPPCLNSLSKSLRSDFFLFRVMWSKIENVNENNNNELIVRNVGKTKIQTFHTTILRKLQLKVDIFTTVATKVQ